jgi:hypothetical protein
MNTYCSVRDQGISDPVSLATETLRADSRAVTCCPEDGRLTLEEWVVVVRVIVHSNLLFTLSVHAMQYS